LITQVFILGNHIQALGIARQVKDNGLEVVLYTSDRFSITRFSNVLKMVVFFKERSDLFEKILLAKRAERNILLFPTNDLMLDFLSTNYKLLINDFYLGIPTPETVNIFYNKRNTYQFAEKHSIPIPMSWYPESLDDLRSLSKRLSYPVILKPAIMHSFHKKFGRKAFKCDSQSELEAVAERLVKTIPIDQLIVQEFLSGGAKTLYSYGAFAADGHVYAAVMANRIRQRPMDFGNSTTYAITCNIPRIQYFAEKILSLTNYSGLAEVEFMYDEKTDQYKFLEINTRAWKWHSISEGIGFSFIGKLIRYYNNNDFAEIKKFNERIAWVERLTDFAIIVKEILKGRMLLKEVINSYRAKKVFAVWSRQDIKPFLMYILLAPYLFFKR